MKSRKKTGKGSVLQLLEAFFSGRPSAARARMSYFKTVQSVSQLPLCRARAVQFHSRLCPYGPHIGPPSPTDTTNGPT